MNQRIFMPRETDIANFAGLLCGQERFHGSPFGEDAVRVFQTDDFVHLHQVDVVRLEAVQAFIDLLGG